ncbi:transposase-like protein, IS1380 ISSpn5 [Streptococcus pneumoniae]|nr:transposase-like protein, IS1380 ISSpn5 [Streptococcus pneumoniae]VQS60849.1 transposase-like protein, IS1380 ISSpn5 [Streptococcus pneumoniae]
MNSLPNHHFQNKSFYQLSFDGGHLTQYGGLIFFQELFSQLKLKERISKYLVTNDQRRYCRYSDSGGRGIRIEATLSLFKFFTTAPLIRDRN